MSDEIGEAYIKVNADTTSFKAQLDAAVAKALGAAEKATKASNKRVVAENTKSAEESAQVFIKAAEKAQAAQQKANAAALADYKAGAQEMAAAEKEAYTQIEAAAKAAARAQEAANSEALAAYKAAASEMATAEKAAYAEVAAAAKAAAAAQKVAAAEAAALSSKSFGGNFAKQIEKSALSLGGLGKSIGSFSADIPADIFGAITTSAKYAVIGVVGLGAALAAIGIENAAKQQAAVVGFTALAGQITATTDATTGLNVATKNLTQAQSEAIGKDFLQRLIDLSNNSAIAQGNLQDVTQQLLALGFTGDESIGIVKDIGNALAASGKTGGALNDGLAGVVTAFAQIKGSGRLLAQDLNQITTRIPSATRVQVYSQLAKDLKLAGANAKEGTPAFSAMTKEVQSLAKKGLIPADTAIASITKVLEDVPGAAADANTGLDALGRQNLTLSGRFEALKDNVRTALAKAFLIPGEGGDGKSLADQFSDQIGKLIPVLTSTIAQIGPQLGDFVNKFASLAVTVLPQLISLVGKVFGILAQGFALATTKGNPLNDFFVGIGKTVQGLVPIFQFLADSFLPIIAGLGPAFRIFGDVVIVLGDVIGALDKVTKPLVFLTSGVIYEGLHLIADVFDLLAGAARHFGDAADYIQSKFIGAIDFVADKVEQLIKALDFHVGPIHIEVPGADAAISKIEDLKGSLNSIPDRTIHLTAVLTPGTAENLAAFGSSDFNDVHGFTSSADAITAELNRQGFGGSTADNLTTNAAKHDTTTDNGAADKKKAAADKAAADAKAAAAKIKAAFADLSKDLKAIGKNTSEQTADQIKTNFDNLIQDLKDSGNKAKVSYTQGIEDKLVADAKKLAATQTKLQAELQIAQGIKDQIIGLGSVTQSNQGIGTTFLGLQNQLRAAIANTQRFTSDIKQLQALGLNRTTIQQLIAAGPVEGLAAAEALVQAGKAGISGAGGINQLQGTLTGLGNDLGNDVAGELYKAGQMAGDGLVQGLKDSEAALESVMNHLADTMVSRLKTDLKIKSPSQIFADMGSQIPAGLAVGINGNLQPVNSAMNNVSSQVINLGGISVNGSIARPTETGAMLGAGIVGVISRQQSQAALNGTG